ncbi:MAG: hypothetical protein N2Z80_07665 [Hydrogenothermaceae bacterium]|nr:hypothetical protein [Hydrogenothermaceae bacterium]
MKNSKALASFLAFTSLLFSSCGGSGMAPGSDYFGTVILSTSIEKPTVDVDLVDLKLENNVCVQYIPMDQSELQTLTFIVKEKDNSPSNLKKSSVYIYDSKLRFYPATNFTDPMQRCFTSYASPSISLEVTSSSKVTFPVIDQDIKSCLIQNYGSIPAICSVYQFNFNGNSGYKVYAALSFKAKEISTGIEKSFEINLGTFNLSDYYRSSQP